MGGRGRATKQDGRLERELCAVAIPEGRRGEKTAGQHTGSGAPPPLQQRRHGIMPGDPVGAGRKTGNSRLAPGRKGLAKGAESRLRKTGGGVPAAARSQLNRPWGLREP
ncbi:hypothetical protein NDU88_003974 [Pleurodeles waltl]|uniref:Uncharacterized protein n=1 Tax=Pleurodeles waltl TaxID=8319 RepID=A0AAV7NI86_PLEWA|nr:hypothetical protein NDU88_003974 [Pleurodeles waltl]